MPLPGRPRNAGGTEVRFHRQGQNSVADTRWRSGPRHRWHERVHVFVQQLGYSPGVQDIDSRADTAAAGTIRRLWRQAVNYIAGPADYSWTANGPTGAPTRPVGITRALRYKASTTFRGAGSMSTRFGAPRPFVPPRSGRHPAPVTIAAGNLQGRPVLRNRLSSLGSRVPPVNRKQQ
jgi:hypothetical protein